MQLFLDIETRSPKPIKHGLWAYAAQAEIRVVSWAADNTPVQVAEEGYANGRREEGTLFPKDLRQAIMLADEIVTHGPFDRVLLTMHCGEMFKGKQWIDSMAVAHSHGLPGKLHELCTLYSIKRPKLDGNGLIRLFCVPRKDGGYNDRWSHPAEWQEFLRYSRRDTEAAREVFFKLPKWNYPNEWDRRVYETDYTINARGMAIDTRFARAVVAILAGEKDRLNSVIAEQTDGAATTVGQRDKLLGFILAEYGVSLPDLTASTLRRRLEDPNLPDDLKPLLAARLEGSLASTAKYSTLLNAVSKDGRLRGSMTYRGATRTGRWSHKLFQPGNLVRPNLPWEEIEAWIDDVCMFGVHVSDKPAMRLASNAVRACIVTPKGKQLAVADYSNIEGRITAAICGEEWKVNAFRDFDNGLGPDLYLASYARTFNVPIKDAIRQVGKVLELSMGYQGGVGAFVTFANLYGLDLIALTASIQLPDDVRAEAEKAWRDWAQPQGRTLDLPQAVWVACDGLKRLWRRAHPGVVAMWSSLEEGFRTGTGLFQRRGAWMTMKLPSGRVLCYPGAGVDDGQCYYQGLDQYTHKWGRVQTHGGKLLENRVQAIAADVLIEGVWRLEKFGYPVVLTVHDEPVCEVFDVETEQAVDNITHLMCEPMPWLPDLPLAAQGYLCRRYHKE